MARLEYQANLGRGAHLKLAWKLGQELRPHKPGAGAAPARQPAAQWSAYRSTQPWLIPTTPFIRARYIKLISCKPIDRAAGTRTLPVPGKAHCSGPADMTTDGYSRYKFLKGQTGTVKRHSCNSNFFCVWHFASFESFSGFESPSIL